MNLEILAYVKSQLDSFTGDLFLLDSATGDVTGDEVIDKIYLVGTKGSAEEIFVQNITLVLEDGATGLYTSVTLDSNAGYGPRLFLADFTQNGINDIKITIDSGGSGGLTFYYIYSFENDFSQLIFDFEEFNQRYEYEVNYQDFYKVEVINQSLGEVFVIDISYKDSQYLSEIYYADSKLKEPLSGSVVPLGGLFPIVIKEKEPIYDLLAIQRIIGKYNADTLGYVQNFLRWNSDQFLTTRFNVAILGTDYGLYDYCL